LQRATQHNVHAQIALEVVDFFAEGARERGVQSVRLNPQIGISGHRYRSISAPPEVYRQHSVNIKSMDVVLQQAKLDVETLVLIGAPCRETDIGLTRNGQFIDVHGCVDQWLACRALDLQGQIQASRNIRRGFPIGAEIGEGKTVHPNRKILRPLDSDSSLDI
jgi:hypothetical protein